MPNVVWIWGESTSEGVPAPPPTLSVSAWPYLFGKQWIRWDTSDVKNIPDEIFAAQIAFVNTFHTSDSIHIEQIKRINPNCFVVAMPDVTLDLVLSHTNWMNMYAQMKAADMIGGRTRYDNELYGNLLNKSTAWIPSPIGEMEYFAKYRDVTKEDYIITLDHQFAPANTVNNVAVLAAVQRKTGCKIIYAAARDQTIIYAELAGLKCEFVGRVPFPDFVEMTAKAKMCVDMYTSHSYGRQHVLCAAVGTYCVGSSWCSDLELGQVDPFEVALAGNLASHWWELSEDYRSSRCEQAARIVEGRYGFDASKDRLSKLIDKIDRELLWR